MFVYRWNGASWVEEQKLRALVGTIDDEFGASVAISGNVIIVGAPGSAPNSARSGSAYVYRWNGASWFEEQELIPSDGDSYDEFGNAVAIDGDTAIVGAWGDEAAGAQLAGSAYIHRWNGETWVEVRKLLPGRYPSGLRSASRSPSAGT